MWDPRFSADGIHCGRARAIPSCRGLYRPLAFERCCLCGGELVRHFMLLNMETGPGAGLGKPRTAGAAGGTVPSAQFPPCSPATCLKRPSSPPVSQIAARCFCLHSQNSPDGRRVPAMSCHGDQTPGSLHVRPMTPCPPNQGPPARVPSMTRSGNGDQPSTPARPLLGHAGLCLGFCCWAMGSAAWAMPGPGSLPRLVGSASESYPEMRSAAVKQHHG